MTLVLALALPALGASVELNPGDDVASLTASLDAGDTIVFQAGVYIVDGPLRWSGAGTAALPITIRGEGAVTIEAKSGWTVVEIEDATFLHVTGLTLRTAEGVDDAMYGVYLKNTSDVTLDGLTIGPLTATAVYADGDTVALTVSACEIHDIQNGSGIYVGCDDAQCWAQQSVFANNWIHDLTATDRYAFYLAKGGQDNAVLDNVIHDVGYRGLSVHSTEYGAYNRVEGNAIWNVVDIGLYVRGAARVRNNLVADVDGRGIYATNNDHDILDDVVVSHNTVWNTTSWAAEIDSWAGRTGNIFANNALSNVTGYGLKIADGGIDDDALLSGNVVSGLVDGVDGYGGSQYPVIRGHGDGDFEDPAALDLYPASGSAVLDAGDPRGGVPDVDFNGAARDGEAPDVGAYEFVGAGNPGWEVSEGFKDPDAYGGSDGEGVGGCCDDGSGGEAALLLLPLAGLRARRRRRA